MEKHTWLLDPGHGGIIAGKYQTTGKQFTFDDKTIYEGEFNRAIVARVMELLQQVGYKYAVVAGWEIDTPLRDRVTIANSPKWDNPVYISVHANAGGGEGVEIFTSRGETLSDKIASVFLSYYEDRGYKVRTDYTDGDPDKEADFYVLRKTKCPAILIENLFMDNEEEFHALLNISDRDQIAQVIFSAIDHIETVGYEVY